MAKTRGRPANMGEIKQGAWWKLHLAIDKTTKENETKIITEEIAKLLAQMKTTIEQMSAGGAE